MKTIIELREEAIKQDKNIEFYLYQLLEEQDKEIERLQHNQEVSTKWEIKLTQKNTKLKEENKRLHSIIKEARKLTKERIDEVEDMKISYVEMSSKAYIKEQQELLEILDKVEENK